MSDEKPPGVEEAPAEFDADYDERSAAADADVAAGRVVPHEEVAKWLRTWGAPDEKPLPKSRMRRPGFRGGSSGNRSVPE